MASAHSTHANTAGHRPSHAGRPLRLTVMILDA
jgi:hypothetical protein